MTRSLAREVGEFGICVNAIAPGLVEHEGQNAPKALDGDLQLKERSIKRLQTPEDLMGTLVFLCSSGQRLHDRAGDRGGWGKYLSLRGGQFSHPQLLVCLQQSTTSLSDSLTLTLSRKGGRGNWDSSQRWYSPTRIAHPIPTPSPIPMGEGGEV